MKVYNLLWKITSGSLELIFSQEKLNMLKFEAFFSQITLSVSAVQFTKAVFTKEVVWHPVYTTMDAHALKFIQ